MFIMSTVLCHWCQLVDNYEHIVRPTDMAVVDSSIDIICRSLSTLTKNNNRTALQKSQMIVLTYLKPFELIKNQGSV